MISTTSPPLEWLSLKKKKKRNRQELAKMWSDWNTCALLVEKLDEASIVETSMAIP